MKYIIEERNTKWISINVPPLADYADMLNRPEDEVFDSRHEAKHAAHERNDASERKAGRPHKAQGGKSAPNRSARPEPPTAVNSPR